MLEVEIGSVAGVLANLTEREAVDPVVKAMHTLSDSGFLAIKDAVAYTEIKSGSEKRRMGVREWRRCKRIPAESVENSVFQSCVSSEF